MIALRGVIGRRGAGIVLQAIGDQLFEMPGFAERGKPLESTDPYMAMAQPNQRGGAGGGGLVMPLQRFAGFDHREGLAGIDALRFEHFGGEDLAHGAFQRQAPVGGAAPRGLASALGAAIEQAASIQCIGSVAHLGKEETAPVADLGVVHAELVAVVTQRQRLRQIAGKGFEPAEMAGPLLVRQIIQPDRRVPAAIAVAEQSLREIGSRHRITEPAGEDVDFRVGTIGGGLRFGAHPAIVGANKPQRKVRTALQDHETPPMATFSDEYWTSPDGLRLHYRDYPCTGGEGRDDRPPLLCLPGLTRNARDFEPVVEAFAGEWRVICPDLRGRGDSEYAKDPQTYAPRFYVADLEALFLRAGITRFVAIGTSLGGLLTMLLAAGGRDRLAGAVLNDIGPVVEQEGLARIRDYVGKGSTFPTWMHAARALKGTVGHAYPDYAMSDWLVLAKRMMELGGNGRIAFDYDMKIAEPFARANDGPGPDLWPLFEALSGRPVLALRGELSDILSAETLAGMQRRMPQMEAVTLPRIGHAPTLAEPVALEAIARLLAKVG